MENKKKSTLFIQNIVLYTHIVLYAHKHSLNVQITLYGVNIFKRNKSQINETFLSQYYNSINTIS